MAGRSGPLNGIIPQPETTRKRRISAPAHPQIHALTTGSRHFSPFSGLTESYSWELLSVANLIARKQQAVNFLPFIRQGKTQFAISNFGARDHAFVMATRKQTELQSALGNTERFLNIPPPSKAPHKSKVKRKRRLPVS